MLNLIVNDKQDYLWAGVGTVAGWGITSFGDPSSCGTSFLETPEHFPNILQETTMSMCFEDEAAAYPLSDNQLCAVDTLSYPYEVCISACNKTNFWFQGSCLLVSWAWEILERPFITVVIPFSLQLIFQVDDGGPISLKSVDQHVQVGDVSFIASKNCVKQNLQLLTVSMKTINPWARLAVERDKPVAWDFEINLGSGTGTFLYSADTVHPFP